MFSEFYLELITFVVVILPFIFCVLQVKIQTNLDFKSANSFYGGYVLLLAL